MSPAKIDWFISFFNGPEQRIKKPYTILKLMKTEEDKNFLGELYCYFVKKQYETIKNFNDVF